ncbi:MAG: hypothetical protein C0522_11485 [Rhodocyclaceae bacterium]|jgi:hypothetical protein|nr:hypothetical protein [Rhodocyclaceae bacterium]
MQPGSKLAGSLPAAPANRQSWVLAATAVATLAVATGLFAPVLAGGEAFGWLPAAAVQIGFLLLLLLLLLLFLQLRRFDRSVGPRLLGSALPGV